MVSTPALVIALAAGLLVFGITRTAAGVKKLGHAIAHVIHHKKPVTPTPAAQ